MTIPDPIRDVAPEVLLDEEVVISLQHRLDELFDRREDLEGVSGMADLLRQAVTWSA